MGSERPEPQGRFVEIVGIELFECLFETEELFLYVIVPVVCAFVCIVASYMIGTVAYQLMFDPNAVDVASRLDLLSIDPEKWFPRS